MSRPVLVLGSTGLLGQALLREARLRGLDVRGVSRGTSTAGPGIDLTDALALAQLLETEQPALVVNAAAQTSLERCATDASSWLINTRLPGHLAGWCAARRARLIHISTDHYFCGPTNKLNDEGQPVTLVNDYARQKYAAEALLASSDQSLVVRTNIVGKRSWCQQPTFAEWAIQALRRGVPFQAFDDMWTSSIDVDAFSAVVFDLAERGARGCLNVASRTSSSKRGFITALARGMGLDPSLAQPSSVHALPGVRRANALGLDVSRAEALLGRRLPDLDAVIDRLTRLFMEPSHAS